MKTIPCPEDGDIVVSKEEGEGRVSIPVQGETPTLVNYMLVGWETVVSFGNNKHLLLTVYWNVEFNFWYTPDDGEKDETPRDSESSGIQGGRVARRKADYGER